MRTHKAKRQRNFLNDDFYHSIQPNIVKGYKQTNENLCNLTNKKFLVQMNIAKHDDLT